MSPLEPAELSSQRQHELQHTPLHAWHVASGAKMADFAGWEMPIEFPLGTVSEHRSVRAGCGLFDVSHMGLLSIEGQQAVAELNQLLTNDLDRLADRDVQYTLLCDELGGVVDDMLATRLAADRILLVPNAANSVAVFALLQSSLPDATVVDMSADWGLIAVQGPGARSALSGIGLDSEIKYMTATTADYQGREIIISRTGYTGEQGYEVLVPRSLTQQLWEQLLDQPGTTPCGLGARDTLRTEMGYPLHGQDIGASIDPLTAGLSWAVAWETDFRGRNKLQQLRAEGPKHRLCGVLLQGRGVPRPGMKVLRDGEPIGVVTSGTFSPSLRQGIAIALLDPRIQIGDEVDLDVRGRAVQAVVTKPPFVDASPR
ncbi:MAG: glycine cleavage system protein T [Micrococcales bacterium]|nr:glycine cleavage system protein T [Micrococcales bacterium]